MPSVPSHQSAPTIPIATSRPTTKASSSPTPRLAPSEVKNVLQVGPHAVEQRPLVGAVEAGRADRRSRAARPCPRPGASRAAPANGGRSTTRPSSRAAQRRERREQAEPDAERVAAARPRLDAVDALARELRRTRRSASGSRAAPGSRPVAQHSSQITKREDPQRGGPVPEPLRVREHLRRLAAREPPGEPSPSPRPSARHGLNSRNQSPISSDRNGTATQKPT